MQVPSPHAGDEFRNVRETAGAHHIGGDGLHVIVQMLARVDVEADEVELLLQLRQIERARETGGRTTRSQRMRVVVEQRNLVKATLTQHASQSIHGIDQVTLAIFRPIRVPRDAGLIRTLEAARRLEGIEIINMAESIRGGDAFH